jgi:hypothetical protein
MKKFDISSAALHILAMAFMLLDHLWATVVPGNEWMTCVGRLAFPIFAFLLVEGFFHTRSRKKYALRLFAGALISEIPFNLMAGGRIFYPVHQNVLWTFLMAFGLLAWNERAKDAAPWRRFLRFTATFLVGLLVGLLTMVDYYGFGIAMVLMFYLFRGNSWGCRLGQLVGLYWINVEMIGGLVYEFTALGRLWVIHQQGFAVLSLLFIWLYRGRKGHSSKVFQYFCYGFYPVHMLILALLR